MSEEIRSEPSPAMPRLGTVNMLKELAGFLVGRQPLSDETKRLLKAAVEDQPNQHKLFLAAVAAHKMHRYPKLLRAIDLLHEKMTDEAILRAVAADPADLRKHLELLMEMEERDISFISQGAGTQAAKHGRSDDPEQQFDIFFNQKLEVGAKLPEGVSPEGRRGVHATVQMLLAMAMHGGLPSPPRSEQRDARAALVKRIMDGGEVGRARPTNGGAASLRPEPGAGDAGTPGNGGGGQR